MSDYVRLCVGLRPTKVQQGWTIDGLRPSESTPPLVLVSGKAGLWYGHKAVHVHEILLENLWARPLGAVEPALWPDGIESHHGIHGTVKPYGLTWIHWQFTVEICSLCAQTTDAEAGRGIAAIRDAVSKSQKPKKRIKIPAKTVTLLTFQISAYGIDCNPAMIFVFPRIHDSTHIQLECAVIQYGFA